MENLNEYRYTKAKEKVENMKSFYYSLISYGIVIPILAYINYKTTSFPWVIFPALGWGIGLICSWMNTHGYSLILGKDWEERKIKEFMSNNKI